MLKMAINSALVRLSRTQLGFEKRFQLQLFSVAAQKVNMSLFFLCRNTELTKRRPV